MELDDFIGQPCRSKMAYEFLPKRKVKIDLEKATTELGSVSTIEVTTKVLLMAKIGDATISLFPSGKILVRGEREEQKARLIAQTALSALRDSVK